MGLGDGVDAVRRGAGARRGDVVARLGGAAGGVDSAAGVVVGSAAEEEGVHRGAVGDSKRGSAGGMAGDVQQLVGQAYSLRRDACCVLRVGVSAFAARLWQRLRGAVFDSRYVVR